MNRRRMEFLLLVLTFLAATTTAKRTSTKTKLDVRIVRSPQHSHDAASAYVLTSQAKTEESHSGEQQEQQHQVSLLSEAQYEALLRQAQKALQGYDLSKLAAAAQQAEQHVEAPVQHVQQQVQQHAPQAVSVVHTVPVVHTAPAAAVAPEHTATKIVYKPEVQLKYVYPTSVSYNTAPAVYGSKIASADDHDSYDHYSKHKFGYRVHDPHSGAAFGHSEVSEGHVTRGHYHVLLPDGRLQNVKYVAGPSGYHATVSYENYNHH